MRIHYVQWALDSLLLQINQHLSDFSLVVYDGVVSPPQLPRIALPRHIDNQR